VIFFIGGVACNLIANYVQTSLDPYRRFVWATAIVALIITIMAAIRDARSSSDPVRESSGDRHTIADRGGVIYGDHAQGNITNTGGGQVIGRQEIHYHYHRRQSQGREERKDRRIFNLPNLQNKYFTGREDILQALESGFKGGTHIQALSGIGGIGKTQTALAYAHRHRQVYRAVLWGKAHTREMLTFDFAAMAGLLDLPEKNAVNRREAVIAVRGWMEENEGWLLILDGANDLQMVREFIPAGGRGHVLFTTQAQATGGIAECHHLEKMSPQEGALFLLRRAKKIAADANPDAESAEMGLQAEALSRELDGLPLALDQAAAYIEETPATLAEYLELYRSAGIKLRAKRGDLPDDHPESVSVTFSLALEKATADSRAATDLLRLCAFLDADAIPEEIFSVSVNKDQSKNNGFGLSRILSNLGPFRALSGRRKIVLGAALETAIGSPDGLVEAIRRAGRFSLLRRDPEAKTFSMHRLVQDVLKDGMNNKTRRMLAGRAVRLVNKAFPDVEHADWPMCDRLIHHVQAVAGLIDEYTFEFLEAARLLNQAGYYLNARARYADAEMLLNRCLAIREKWLWGWHPDTAISLNNLAEIYRVQGKYEQAEPLYKRAIEIVEKPLQILEKISAGTYPQLGVRAAYLSNLANLYQSQGKYEQAEPLNIRALSIREKALGGDHCDTAASLNNLAELYKLQGKYEQAEPLFNRALEIFENRRGPDHPDTGSGLSNLAELYWLQGKYEQAEPLYNRALNIREKALGPDHPGTAASLNNLATLHQSQRSYDKAEPLFIRALEIVEQALGAYHPLTASGLSNLAVLYDAQGKYEQAEPRLKRALDIREQILGLDHPDTAISLNNLALHRCSQGDYVEAESLLNRALRIYEDKLGPDHPNTATGLNNLAEFYRRLEKYEQAEPLFKRALAIREKTVGPDHFETATVLNNLALLYKSQGNYAEAER